MRLIKERNLGSMQMAIYETNGYQVSIHTINSESPITTVSCKAVESGLYKPEIICAPSGISINFGNINVCCDETHKMNELIKEAQKAQQAASEIYHLLEKLNFFT